LSSFARLTRPEQRYSKWERANAFLDRLKRNELLMRNTNFTRYCLWGVWIVSLLAAILLMDNCTAQTPTDLFPRSTQIVDTASYASETDICGLTVLTIDQDGRVGITTFHHSKDGFQKKKYEV
jgi:hypothetical protein